MPLGTSEKGPCLFSACDLSSTSKKAKPESIEFYFSAYSKSIVKKITIPDPD
ncbi:hypothetical protein LDE01_13180 [Lactobacillus delbrueckii subsp. delbrueckii]|nr:hypothetical protein LDE01_13180 [Lactobacillus delbrueckii subsp. delbrueckii]